MNFCLLATLAMASACSSHGARISKKAATEFRDPLASEAQKAVGRVFVKTNVDLQDVYLEHAAASSPAIERIEARLNESGLLTLTEFADHMGQRTLIKYQVHVGEGALIYDAFADDHAVITTNLPLRRRLLDPAHGDTFKDSIVGNHLLWRTMLRAFLALEQDFPEANYLTTIAQQRLQMLSWLSQIGDLEEGPAKTIVSTNGQKTEVFGTIANSGADAVLMYSIRIDDPDKPDSSSTWSLWRSSASTADYPVKYAKSQRFVIAVQDAAGTTTERCETDLNRYDDGGLTAPATADHVADYVRFHRLLKAFPSSSDTPYPWIWSKISATNKHGEWLELVGQLQVLAAYMEIHLSDNEQ